MRCTHGCCVSSTHCLLMHIPASDRYKSLWTLETHCMPFPVQLALTSSHRTPMEQRNASSSSSNLKFTFHIFLDYIAEFALWTWPSGRSVVCRHILWFLPGEKCNNIGHSFAVYNRNMKRHKGISRRFPTLIAIPNPLLSSSPYMARVVITISSPWWPNSDYPFLLQPQEKRLNRKTNFDKKYKPRSTDRYFADN